MAKKIIVPPSEDISENINTFSDTMKQVLDNVKIQTNEDGSEYVELALDDRIVTFVIDQSGSMTWNDNNGFRYDIIKRIIEDLELNYPGEVKYNIIKYGSIFSNILFFGVIQQNDFNPSDVDSLNSLYFANEENSFAGIRVVRNVERMVDGEILTYPTSPIDGDILQDGFISKIFDNNLDQNTVYYYTVYTYDNNYRFSKGVNINISPQERIVPRGITTFANAKINNMEVAIGSGIPKDDNTLALWHMDENSGQNVFDFSSNKYNLVLNNYETNWINGNLIPSGSSAIYFNGIDDYVDGGENVDILNVENEDGCTFMFWLQPLNVLEEQIILSSTNGEFVNFNIGIINENIFVDIGTTRFITTDSFIALNEWQHIAITYKSNVIQIYFNGSLTNVTTSTIINSGSPNISHFSIGAQNVQNNFSKFYHGKLTEISIHNTLRDLSYINKYVVYTEIINKNTQEFYIDPQTNMPLMHYAQLEGDNGDRLNIFKYIVPDDADYLGGTVVVVRNADHIPTWYGDGKTISSISNISSGEHFISDSDDFVLGETYYYNIFNMNDVGNFNYFSDASNVIVTIPMGVSEQFLPDNNIPAPEIFSDFPLSVGGYSKVGLRWNNSGNINSEAKKVKIYYSTNAYPVSNSKGGYSGSLIFTGSIEDNSFVHRNLNNNEEYFYTIVNIDRYGRSSIDYLNAFVVTDNSLIAEHENLIPLMDIQNIKSEIIDENSISISWDKPIKNPENINAFFGDTVLFYATITDEFGKPIGDDSIIDININASLTKDSGVEDVFNSNVDFSFEDKDAYSFTSTNIKDGIIRATLKMSENVNILSRVSKAVFTLQVKSFIPSNQNNNGETASDISVNNVNLNNNYNNIINELIDDEETTIVNSTSNIFEYNSNSITVSFDNPWSVELTNRDNKTVQHRCYYYSTDKSLDIERLTQKKEVFDGVYIKASSPFVVRAKVTYKGEPVSSGFIDVAIWDAQVDLCECAKDNISSDCKPTFTKQNVSDIVTLPSYRLPIINGIETITNGIGQSENVPVSYVDIPLSAPDSPLNIKLYAKSTYSGLSALQSMDIVFENILKIDLNAQAPFADGVNTMEQQATVYIINPDFPENKSLYSYLVNNSIVKWNIESRYALEQVYQGNGNSTLESVDIIDRNIYSIDNVPLTGGIYSYTRSGTARNVFMGPAKNRNKNILETYEISASISYADLNDTARQEITINHYGKELKSFGARFLMEMEYGYRRAKSNRIWTDGIDYKKIYISRNPAIAQYPDFLHGDIFRNCAEEEESPILELNSTGQIVALTSNENVEFLWGNISEYIDAYTGRKYIEKEIDGFSSFGSANVVLNDEDISDKTVVYCRINDFVEGANCNREQEIQCDDINLKCLDLTTCDLPLGNIFISGETYIYVDGEPLRLIGGGDENSGVPPCPLCLNEPLRVATIFTKIDNIDTKDLGVFPVGSILVDSTISIRVEVSFAGLPVPNGTPVYVVIGNNSGNTVFGAYQNIVFTQIDDTNIIDEYSGSIISYATGKSYADIQINVLHIPLKTTTESLKIFATYDEKDAIERKVVQAYDLTLVINESENVQDPPIPPEEPELPEKEDTIYSKTLERYNIDTDVWSYATNMSIARSAFSTISKDNKIYVFGGVIDNNLTITAKCEMYDSLLDSWNFIPDMPTPRFGTQIVNIEDDIYIIGGCYYDSNNENYEVSNIVEKYNITSQSWETLSEMPSIGEGLNEEKYGVAYGTASYIQQEDGSDTVGYIYILSGVVDIYSNGSQINVVKMNDRILRYSVDYNSWDILDSSLVGEDLENYQRISPLSFVSNTNSIIVFNGAQYQNNNLIFIKEPYTINIENDINLTELIPTVDFTTLPIAKYQSAMVEYNISSEPSSLLERYLFVLGGANENSLNLDIVERIDISSNSYIYTNSDSFLESLQKGRNSFGAAFAYGYEDEYGELSPFIYVMGGKTSGNEDGTIEIEFLV